MTELDVIEFISNGRNNFISHFTQLITISFAMVVAAYYFLHKAGLIVKILSYTIYVLGFFTFMGFSFKEASLVNAGIEALRAIPLENHTALGKAELAFLDSDFNSLINYSASWFLLILPLAIFYIVFFWKRIDQEATS